MPAVISKCQKLIEQPRAEIRNAELAKHAAGATVLLSVWQESPNIENVAEINYTLANTSRYHDGQLAP